MPQRKEILTKEREKNWRIPPSVGIPFYDSENDPYCPTGQIRKFNQEKKIKAKSLAIHDKNTERWIKNTLDASSIETPQLNNLSLKAKALDAAQQSQFNHHSIAEIEIIQKIIVRENLLSELYTLLKSQNDIMACLGEVSELIRALRYQTVDIVEDISSWQQSQSSFRPFLFRGMNYLIKIKSDLDFLDNYEEVVEKFCFEFSSNPLAYKGGGNIILGYEIYQSKPVKSMDSWNVDGIEVDRLRMVEKVIRDEIKRLGDENKYNQNHSSIFIEAAQSLPTLPTSYRMNETLHDHELSSPNVMESSSFETFQVATMSLDDIKKDHKVKNKPKSTSYDPRKIKKERIAVLQNEANELKAMMAHIEDQINAYVIKHNKISEKKKSAEQQRNGASMLGKDLLLQHLSAEISVANAKLLEINYKIKDLQRESYFIGLERRRKLGVAQNLKDELEFMKKQKLIQKKLSQKIKEEGLLAAIQTFSNPFEQKEKIILQDELSKKMEKISSANSLIPKNKSEKRKKKLSKEIEPSFEKEMIFSSSMSQSNMFMNYMKKESLKEYDVNRYEFNIPKPKKFGEYNEDYRISSSSNSYKPLQYSSSPNDDSSSSPKILNGKEEEEEEGLGSPPYDDNYRMAYDSNEASEEGDVDSIQRDEMSDSETESDEEIEQNNMLMSQLSQSGPRSLSRMPSIVELEEHEEREQEDMDHQSVETNEKSLIAKNPTMSPPSISKKEEFDVVMVAEVKTRYSVESTKQGRTESSDRIMKVGRYRPVATHLMSNSKLLSEQEDYPMEIDADTQTFDPNSQDNMNTDNTIQQKNDAFNSKHEESNQQIHDEELNSMNDEYHYAAGTAFSLVKSRKISSINHDTEKPDVI